MMPADFSSFSTYLAPFPDMSTSPGTPPNTSNWLTSGLGAGFYGGLSAGARGLQAGAQLFGATDAANAIGDWAERQYQTEQTFERPDLEEHPWSLTGLPYTIAKMVPMGAAMIGGGALAALAAPEEAAGAAVAGLSAAARLRLLGATGAAFLPAAGENVQRQIDYSGELTEPGKALALGVPEAVVQGYLPGRIESLFGKGIMRGIAHGAATQAVAGGATAFLTQQMGDPNRDFADRASEIVSQALGGAGLGALMGGVAGALHKNVATPPGDVDLVKATDPIKQLWIPIESLPPEELMRRLNDLAPQRTPEGKTEADYKFGRLYEEVKRRNAAAAQPPEAESPPTAPPAGPPQITYRPGETPIEMPSPLQGVPSGEILGRIDTLMREHRTQATVEELRLLNAEMQRREAATAAAKAAEPPLQGLLPPPATRETIPLQGMSPQELMTRFHAVQENLAINPQDEAMLRASEMLGQEFERRAAGVAPPAPEVPLGSEKAPAGVLGGPPREPPAVGAPAVGAVPAAQPPVLDFTGRFLQKGSDEVLAQAAASPESWFAAKQQLLAELVANGDRKLRAGLKTFGKAFDLLTEDGTKLRPEFRPEARQPPTFAPGAPGPLVERWMQQQRAPETPTAPPEPGAPPEPTPAPPVAPITDWAPGALLERWKQQQQKPIGEPPVVPPATPPAALPDIQSARDAGINDVRKGLLGTKAAAGSEILTSGTPEQRQAYSDGIRDGIGGPKGTPATPVTDKAPIETVEDRVAAINGAQAVADKLPESPAKKRLSAEAETVTKMSLLAEKNSGLAEKANVRAERLRDEAAAMAQRPGGYVSPDLEPTPRSDAVQAPVINLDTAISAAQRALKTLGGKLDINRPDVAAAYQAHADWLASIRKALAGPEALAAVLAKDPERLNLESETDNSLGGLKQISRTQDKAIRQYLGAQHEAVLQALRNDSDSRARVIASRDGLSVSQLAADVTDQHLRGVLLHDAVGHIIENTPDPEEAGLAAKLYQAMPKDIKTGFRDDVLDKEGEYFPKSKTSMLYNAGSAVATTLHEAAHSVFHKVLDGTSAAAQEMRGIYEQLKSTGDQAGITDAHEMVSEAFANSVYRDFLKSKFVQGTSLWDRLIDAGRSALGLDPRLYNAFDRIMSLGDDLIKERDQFPNDAYVGPDSFARNLGSKASANAGDQARESTIQQLANAFRAGASAGGFDMRNAIRKGSFGWTDSYRLGQLYGDAIASMRPYLEALSRGEAREGALYKGSQMARTLVNTLSEDGKDLVHSIMADATFYGMDPRKPAPQDIQDTPGRLKIYQELADKWDQLKTMTRIVDPVTGKVDPMSGGEKAYEALRAKASADLHAVLTDRLQTAERALGPGYNMRDVFKDFDQRTDIHTDPTKTEKFFKDAVTAKQKFLSEYRDKLANTKAMVGGTEVSLDKAIEVKEATIASLRKEGKTPGEDYIKELQDLRDQRADIKDKVGKTNAILDEVQNRRDAAAKAPYFHLGRDGNYFITAKLFTNPDGSIDKEKLAQFNEHLDANGFHNIALMLNGENNTMYTRVKSPSEMRELTKVVKEAQKKGLLSQGEKDVGVGEATHVFETIAPAAMRRAVGEMIASRPKDLEGVDEGTTEQMNEAFGHQVADLQRTLLNTMAENSIGRLMTRRANVQGFSRDMSESANYASQVMSRSLGRITMADEVGTLSKQMANEVHDLNHTQPGTNIALAASQAVSELMLRERLRSTYVPPTVLDAIRHLSHTIHVGSSPVYFLTLMSQLMTTAYPELAKTHDYGMAAKAMWNNGGKAIAIVKAIMASPDWNTAGITRDALETDYAKSLGITAQDVNKVMGMVSRGVMGTAMYSTQMTEHSNLGHVIPDTMLKAANAMGLYAELFPRLVTG